MTRSVLHLELIVSYIFNGKRKGRTLKCVSSLEMDFANSAEFAELLFFAMTVDVS